jgi:hypothetical protein
MNDCSYKHYEHAVDQLNRAYNAAFTLGFDPFDTANFRAICDKDGKFLGSIAVEITNPHTKTVVGGGRLQFDATTEAWAGNVYKDNPQPIKNIILPQDANKEPFPPQDEYAEDFYEELIKPYQGTMTPEEKKDILGFYHTHTNDSRRDNRAQHPKNTDLADEIEALYGEQYLAAIYSLKER